MAAVVVLATAGGCVERRMTIRSNPPGALVYVDDYEIGITPGLDFVHLLRSAENPPGEGRL